MSGSTQITIFSYCHLKSQILVGKKNRQNTYDLILKPSQSLGRLHLITDLI